MVKSTNFTVKKWLFGTIAFVSVFIAQTTIILGTSRFLSFGLIDLLPILLLVVSAVAVINFGFNLLMSRRFDASKSFILSLFLMMGLITLASYMRANVTLYLFLTLFIGRLSFDVFDTLINNLASTYVNSRQAKSFLPLIRGSIDGGILSASSFVFITSFTDLYIDPIWIMMGGVVAMIFAIMTVERMFEPVTGNKEFKDPDEEKDKFKQSLSQSIEYIFKKSKLFTYMTFLFVCFGAVTVLFVYVYNEAFGANMIGDNLTRFLSIVNFLAVSGRAIFDFKFLKKAIYRIGLANVLLFYPWVMFIVSVLLSLSFQNLYFSAGLYMFHVFSYYSYVAVTTQSMFGMAPKEFNQSMFFFIKGFLPEVSALFAAIALTLVLAAASFQAILVVCMLLLCTGGSLVLGLRIKREFQLELLKNIESEDKYLRGNAIDLMGEKIQFEKGEKILRKLVVDEKEDVEIREKSLNSLVEIGNANSIREFLLILENDKNYRLKYYSVQAIKRVFERMDDKKLSNLGVTKLLMIDVFNKVYEENLPLPIKLEVNQVLKMFGFDVLLDFYKQHFVNSSDYIKASIIEALAVSGDRGLITLLEPYLDSPDLGIRTAAIVGLWNFEELRNTLMAKMVAIFAVKDNIHRMAALKLICQLKLRNMDNYVLDLVAMPDKELSTMAILTSIILGREGAFKVLIRKLIKFAMVADREGVEFVFKKFYLLDLSEKKRLISELKALSTANFEQLRVIFNQSDRYFDLTLANLFTL